jgi:hypothetical protein
MLESTTRVNPARTWEVTLLILMKVKDLLKERALAWLMLLLKLFEEGISTERQKEAHRPGRHLFHVT